jgi:hypothetical protein
LLFLTFAGMALGDDGGAGPGERAPAVRVATLFHEAPAPVGRTLLTYAAEDKYLK